MYSDRENGIEYWLGDDGLVLLSAWARDGYTIQEIANRMGISRTTLYTWSDKYKDIKEAIANSKELTDYKVENALLKRALGYKTQEIKVTIGKKIVSGETVEMLKETTTKEVAPDVNACLAWLNNRRYEQWKRNRDKVVDLNAEDNNITITINRGNPEKDNLGNDVNQEVEFKKEAASPENTERDLDEWPEDWEDED